MKCLGAVTRAPDLRSPWWLDSQEDEEYRLRRLPLPACDHSAGDLAVFSIHFKLSRRRRFVGGARNHGFLRIGSAVGEPFRADDRGRFAQASLGLDHQPAAIAEPRAKPASGPKSMRPSPGTVNMPAPPARRRSCRPEEARIAPRPPFASASPAPLSVPCRAGWQSRGSTRMKTSAE
jgi:hypothetical protein